MEERPRLRIVCYRLDLPKGMERSLSAVVSCFARTHEIELVILRHDIAPTLVDVTNHVSRVVLIKSSPMRLARLLAWGPPSPVVLVVGLWAALAWPPLLRRSTKGRTIIWDHSLVPSRFDHDRRLRRLRPLIRRSYRRADQLVCVSRPSAEFVRAELDVERRGRPVVSVIPNAIPPARRNVPPKGRSSRVRLLCIGELSTIKNTRLAIDAMAHLPSDWELTCLGDGPARSELERRAAELGVADRVIFLGFIEDIESHLERADVVAHPSLAETFCVAAFEAANHAVPVACLSQGSLADSVPTYIVGVAAPTTVDAREFAATIQACLGLRSDAAAFEAAARRRQELSRDQVARLWQEILCGTFAI